MENENKQLSRVSFLSWGLGVLAMMAIPVFLRPKKRLKSSKTVKMLSEDGQLVNIDIVHIPLKRKKINTSDIQSWINKKRPSL